jgi:hypothetical protein
MSYFTVLELMQALLHEGPVQCRFLRRRSPRLISELVLLVDILDASFQLASNPTDWLRKHVKRLLSYLNSRVNELVKSFLRGGDNMPKGGTICNH